MMKVCTNRQHTKCCDKIKKYSLWIVGCTVVAVVAVVIQHWTLKGLL